MLEKIMDFICHLLVFGFLLCVMWMLTYVPVVGPYVNTAIVLYALWDLVRDRRYA